MSTRNEQNAGMKVSTTPKHSMPFMHWIYSHNIANKVNGVVWREVMIVRMITSSCAQLDKST